VPALTFGGGAGVGDGLGDGDKVGDAEGVDGGDGDGIAIGLAPHAATITAARPRTSKLLALTPPSSTAQPRHRQVQSARDWDDDRTPRNCISPQRWGHTGYIKGLVGFVRQQTIRRQRSPGRR
jgi:hypothetical protein